jgi:hypothetical protein
MVASAKTFTRLRIYNLFMGLLHLAQAGLIVYLTNSFKVPVNTSYLAFNSSAHKLEPVSRHLFDVRLGYGVALFLLISAIAHFLIATAYYQRYAGGLKRGMNLARWVEYALSASLMIILIGLLSGIYDLSTLVMMFGLTAVMNLCGMAMEIYNQGRERIGWTAYNIGSLAGAIPWIVIVIYFLGAATAAHNPIPTFVYWIYVSIFFFFSIFALNMYLQYKRIGPWRNYLFGEYMYVLLSLVAKSALAWQIFFGTLRPV